MVEENGLYRSSCYGRMGCRHGTHTQISFRRPEWSGATYKGCGLTNNRPRTILGRERISFINTKDSQLCGYNLVVSIWISILGSDEGSTGGLVRLHDKLATIVRPSR